MAKHHPGQRLHSPQLVYDSNTAAAKPDIDATTSQSANGYENQDLNFASQYAAKDVETVRATKLQNTGALIPQGTLIAGILETAIHSDLPGMVRAIVSENVYGFDGMNLLIPKGTKMIGRYHSGLVRGQSRVFIIWERLSRSDGVSVNIGSFGTDNLGRAGLGGEIDTHFFERFGSSVMLSLIDSGLKAGVQSLDENSAANIALESGDDFSNAAEIALENSIAIPPTIHVDQGTRINVFVGKDIDFSSINMN